MPLAGGSSDKFGNRYEGRWTVYQIIRILRERASSICLEPVKEDGCEFIIKGNDFIEYHQVKRQNSHDGRWTLSSLKNNGVLSYFKSKLENPLANCVFTSTNAAYQLDELCSRARNAGSFVRFDKEFLRSKNRCTDFNELCTIWELEHSKETAFNLLQRIWPKTIDEETLLYNLENEIEPLIEGNPRSVIDIVAQYVLDSVNKEINSNEIWYYLTSVHELRKCLWAQDHLIFEVVEELKNQFVSPLVREMISQQQIPMSVSESIIAQLKNPNSNKQGFIVTGEAGTGKSCVVLEVAQSLLNDKWLVLPIRVTTLEPVRSPVELGKSLGLPGSPVHVISELSLGKPCLLIIDQLDAISLISGRNPAFFDCFDALIHQAEQYKNIRILIACRKFDLENDYRFKRLCEKNGILEQTEIKRFEKQTVLDIVTCLGYKAIKFSPKQIELLSLPLHLKLFLQISTDNSRDYFSFESAKDLFDRFWDVKQLALHEKLDSSGNWVAVVDAMCSFMNDNQQLSVPKNYLDNWQHDYSSMVSEHVLTEMNKRISFFHESFFDYCFARRFFTKGRSLEQFLTDGEQHIFKRAQCRQILIQQRSIDFDEYCINIRLLLAKDSIRFHLKEVVASVLGNLNEPDKSELEIVLNVVQDKSNPIRNYLFQVISRSPNWFNLFQSRQMITDWLKNGKEEYRNRAADFCRNIGKYRSGEVVRLFADKIGVSEEWSNLIHSILYYNEIFKSRTLFELFLKCIDCGVYDPEVQRANRIDDMFYPLCDGNPEWACEALGKYFSRLYEINSKNKVSNKDDILPIGRMDDLTLNEVAKKAPYEFIKRFIPLIKRIVREHSNPEDKLPFKDNVFSYRQFGGSYNMTSTLLSAMELALMKVAGENVTLLRENINKLDQLDSDTIQFLVTRAYTGNGKELADEAVEFMCKRHSRLHSGYSNDGHWATRCLIEAISPYCSDERYYKLENHILSYYTEWEKSKGGFKDYGYAQFELLSGLTKVRMSKKAKSQLEQWQRKFNCGDINPPEPIEFKTIGSPIPKEAGEKMTDEQWIKAILKYNTDHTDFSKGGAQELSGLLELETKEDPVRFAKLGIKLSDEVHPFYFNAILRGLAEKAEKLEDVLEFCYKCHEIPGKPCGRWIHQPIAKFSTAEIPKKALELVAWYATEDTDPEKELWRTKASNGAVYNNGNITMDAINSVRCSACESLATLISDDKNRIELLRERIECVINDISPSVRVSAASVLLSIQKHDPDLAVEMFLTFCNTDDVVLCSHSVELFLCYATRNYYEKLKPILLRMLESQNVSVVQSGSAQMSLAALKHFDAVKYADECLNGTVNAQIGIAQVCSANVNNKEFAWFCIPKLNKLFCSPYKEVRGEAGKCFHQLSVDSIGDHKDLIDSYVDSPAFQDDPYLFMHTLEKSIVIIPDSIFNIAEKIISELKNDIKDQFGGLISITDSVCKLLMRVYCQARDIDTQKRCLDCFDELLRLGVYGINEVIALQDR